ncbi:MAG: hypothetical protein M3N95_00050, partial [Actinomycetota bacterium]|nr:hypothetical protein [Actinomycetota bacterium]
MAAGLVAFACGLLVLAFAVVPASALATDGTVTVIVNQDFFGDGTYHPEDPGVAGVTVTMTGGDNQVLTGVTDASGTVRFAASALSGVPYRVQVQPLPSSLSYLQAAPAASNSNPNNFSSFTSFVNPSAGTAVTLRVGVWDPANYVQTNANLAVPVQASFGNGGLGTDPTALVTTPNSTAGPVTQVGTYPGMGTTFGVAWDKTNKVIYTSAFAKAYAPYGNLTGRGVGEIYRTDPVTKATIPFANVANAGTSTHSTTLNSDWGFYGVPGTQSLGGMAISEDGTKLYVVNMNAKTLVTIPINQPTVQSSVIIRDPGCAGQGGVWRPMAVTVHDGNLYIGGVCDASLVGTRDYLAAVVWKYSGTGAFPTVPYYVHGLDFLRGDVSGNVPNKPNQDLAVHWNPWTSSFDPAQWAPANAYVVRPEPELATIAFDTDGSLVLGFRDRSGDHLGNNSAAGVNGSAGNVSVITGGDLNRVCNVNGTLIWEGDAASCPSHNNGANSGGEPLAVSEFYPWDWAPYKQLEAAQGSVVLVPALSQVTSTFLDPALQLYSDGLGFFAANGSIGPYGSSPSYSKVVVGASNNPNVPNGVNGFGKANGLGAIAVLADNAPVQIGNRVWFDTNHNGIQDAGEPSVPGVSVKLHDGGPAGPV